MGAYAMFYIDLPLVILAEMKHHFRVLSAKGCTDRRSSGTRFDCPEIYAVPPTRIAHSETRADTLRWGRDETSVFDGRCCRPEIAEISRYSRLGRI